MWWCAMNIFRVGLRRAHLGPCHGIFPRALLRLAVVALALLSLCVDDALAAKVDREEAVFALMAMKDSRERLISGVFRASGRAQSGDDYTRALDVYQAFDYSADLYRMDETETVLGERARREADPRRNVRTEKFARNRDASTHFLGRQDVEIERPEHRPQPSFTVFDVRTVGIMSWSAFKRGASFADLFPKLLERKITVFSQEANGLIKIAWEMGESREAQLIVWLDSKRGHSPVRLELRVRMNPEDEWSAIKATSEATWEEVNGVWVPKTVVLVNHFNATKTYELAFEWESVNEPVPAKLFTWHGFDLPSHTLILDNRLGTPIQLGHVGDFVAPVESAAESTGRTRIAIVVATLSAAVILLMVFLRWRRGRAKA